MLHETVLPEATANVLSVLLHVDLCHHASSNIFRTGSTLLISYTARRQTS